MSHESRTVEFPRRDLLKAGGALLVSEAGGRVTLLDGAPFRSRGGQVLASNGLIHEAMLDVIRAARVPRSAELGQGASTALRKSPPRARSPMEQMNVTRLRATGRRIRAAP
jgi:hypothetical protein